ncbi:FAD-binding and (Fe-S)-binding domain-containing protein [Mangrovihabitans endophyticus]|uniref:Lactate dehydrogenase n=1 Tax=Mangrovihabitans endophyticus TaxID=1751298 RepID=A0A8J3C3Z7_9ACTN|nr:FAD-binding and (Fe-S)-binding domain-containing protein [Mangrovihabitans endophyticus]GGL15418.1 lactate dehydrogenase [Mangrovihabitans endophyticus]
MDLDRRLATTLRADTDCEVLHDAASRSAYARDASNYRVLPSVVARPRTVAGLTGAVEAARGLGVPVTMRGAGTSVAGNAIGTGLVVDCSRYLTAITDLDPAAGTVHVEPGVVLTALQKAAAPHGLRFAPDPSTANRCTLGGMIGNNACGSHSVRWGTTAENVETLDVWSAGRISTVGAGAAPAGLEPKLRAFADRHLALLRRELTPWPRRVSGYGLEHLLPEQGFHVARALVGTEGGCAPVTGATLRLVRPPVALGLLVLGFDDDVEAADAVPALLAHQPYTLEGFSVDLLGGLPVEGLLPAGKAWLFAEVGGDSVAEVTEHAGRLAAAIGRTPADPACAVVLDASARAQIWALRADGAGRATRAPSGAAAWPGLEDAVVPPQHLGSYLRDFRALMDEYGLTGSPYGHFGEGCLHIRLDFDFAGDAGVDRFASFMSRATDVIVAHHGSVSGEHGDGRARGELLAKMYPPAVLAAFAEFKGIWDTAGTLNPQVVVAPPAITDDLAPARPVTRRLTAPLTLHADRGDLAAAVHRCVGVGKCVSTQTDALMCPSFQAVRDDRHSTRGRARLLQDYVTGATTQAPVAEALDLCLACKGCKSECPTGVDMASYKAHFLQQRYRRRLRPRSHYVLGWLPTWLRLGHRLGPVASVLSRSPALGRLAMRLGGLARDRTLPPIPRRSFRSLHRARGRAAGRPDERASGRAEGRSGAGRSGAGRGEVVLWPDTFTDHLEPQVALAAVRVLEAAGHTVVVPSGPVCCGLTWISTGQIGHATKVLRRTLDHIADSDAPIVVLEPSCAASLREELPQLLADDPRAARLAGRIVSLAQLLAGDRRFDLSGTRVALQPHCHQRSGWGFAADLELLTGSGATVTETIAGCCGLAGNFGMERGHEEVSAKVAGLHLLPALDAAGPDATVLADGYSCRTQVASLAPQHRSRHLAEVLADALPDAPAEKPPGDVSCR